jgi:tetratricopeptide (TPR) repeat protein
MSVPASSSWYIRGKGNRLLGPFTAEELIDSWRAGQVDAIDLCWCEGMPQWVSLASVEPFPSMIRAARRSARRRFFGFLGLGLAAVAVLAAFAGMGYLWWTESAAVGKAKRLIEAGTYDEALALVRPLADRSRFSRRQAGYWLALALVRQFAAASKLDDPDDDPLQEAKKRLEELLASSARWRLRAKSDLAGIIDAVPRHTPDALARSVRIAGLLSALQLAEGKQLSHELLGKAKSVWADPQRGPEQADGEAVVRIVDGDPDSAADILAALLPESDREPHSIKRKLDCLGPWVRGQPALARLFGSALADRAGLAAAAGRLETADRLLAAAEEIDPDHRERYAELREANARKQLDSAKRRLDEKDYAMAVEELDRVQSRSTPLRAELLGLYLEAATGLDELKTERATARRALDRVLQLDDGALDTEKRALLWLKLHPEPSAEKLQRCLKFFTAYPDSPQCTEFRLSVLADAVAFFRQTGESERARTGAYLDAARSEARGLLEKQPATKDLDYRVFDLAACLAGAERYDEAAALGKRVLDVCPQTPLADELKQKIAEWRQGKPKQPGTGPAPPRHEPRPEGELTLEEKLLKRKRTISTPTAVYDAVKNEDLWIIEIADACTAEQFNAEETQLLRKWVSRGGVLWVNSSVLSLFAVQYTSFQCLGTSLECEPAGGNLPVLEDCKKVWLQNCADRRAHTLQHKGVIPLLAFREAHGPGFGAPPHGSTVWSLVPYGRGWLSDWKRLDLKRDDGALFWGRFCQFCLHEIPWPKPSERDAAGAGKPDAEDAAQQPLTGQWRHAEAGTFAIEDDGKTVAVELKASNVFRFLKGSLSRPDSTAGKGQRLRGKFEVTYTADRAQKRYYLEVVATWDDRDHLKVRSVDECPTFDRNGTYSGRKRAAVQVWTRWPSAAGDRPGWPGRGGFVPSPPSFPPGQPGAFPGGMPGPGNTGGGMPGAPP